MPGIDLQFEVEALLKVCTREELAQLVQMLTAELDEPKREQEERTKEAAEE